MLSQHIKNCQKPFFLIKYNFTLAPQLQLKSLIIQQSSL